MQPAPSTRIPDGFMAAMRLGGEKPHQGLPGENPAPNQVREVCNFAVLLGMRGQAELNRVGPRSTGKERDTESGLDMFGARYYGSSLGRFMTPDWAAKPTNVPYANFGNPQSLNLYSYVENNPTTTGDPDGHCCDWQYIAGAVQAYASDTFAAGAFHGNSDNSSFQAGQITGDKAALAQGLGETAAGQAGVGGGTVMTLSVVGAPEGLVTVTGSAALEAHGAVTATAAGVHLMAEGGGKETGSYTNTHESGRTYSGKGDRARSQASGQRVEKQTGDKHTATDWKPSANDREAFKDESRRLDANGGANSNGNHNQIESPGKKYRKEDGSN